MALHIPVNTGVGNGSSPHWHTIFITWTKADWCTLKNTIQGFPDQNTFTNKMHLKGHLYMSTILYWLQYINSCLTNHTMSYEVCTQRFGLLYLYAVKYRQLLPRSLYLPPRPWGPSGRKIQSYNTWNDKSYNRNRTRETFVRIKFLGMYCNSQPIFRV